MIPLLERLGYSPKYCVWELTLTCNMRCLHCGSIAGRGRDDELSFDECLSVADQLARLGCKRVTLGGGEPTLHPRWDQIACRLTSQGVATNIISNGWTWSLGHIERAKRACVMNVAFSLDGFEEAHDKIRRKGSFQRVVEASQASVERGLPVSVVSHVNRLNYRYLPELRTFLHDLGVSSWQIQLGNPAGVMGENQELVIQPDELLWLIPLIAEMRTDETARPHLHPGDNVGYYGMHEIALRDQGARLKHWIGCRAGCQVLGIESNGNVKGCLSLPSRRHGDDIFLEGNLRDSSLGEIWGREGAFAFNRGFSLDQLEGFCGVCRYKDICRGGCAWTAYSHTRNRFDNPYCFYRQAIEHRRLDLLGDDEPNAVELGFFGAGSPV